MGLDPGPGRGRRPQCRGTGTEPSRRQRGVGPGRIVGPSDGERHHRAGADDSPGTAAGSRRSPVWSPQSGSGLLDRVGPTPRSKGMASIGGQPAPASPITVEDPVSAMAPVRWLLELTAPPDGALLTQSGYLPRASVAEAAEHFGWWDWPKPPRSEADLHQLTTVREAARRLRLVRRRGRRLVATARGIQLHDRPTELWSTVATETEEGGEFPLAVTEAVGLRLMVGRAEARELAADVHPVLSAQGWSTEGAPITLDQVRSAIYIPIRWWGLFGVLDEECSRWDPDARLPLNRLWAEPGRRVDGARLPSCLARAGLGTRSTREAC